MSGWTTSKYTITGLNKFTRYSVSVKAFNSISHGPASAPVTATTLEGGIFDIIYFFFYL